jgi:hypothetical protein
MEVSKFVSCFLVIEPTVKEDELVTLAESNNRDLNLKLDQCLNKRNAITFCRMVGSDLLAAVAPLAISTAATFCSEFFGGEIQNNQVVQSMFMMGQMDFFSQTIRSIFKNLRDCKINEATGLKNVHSAIKIQFKNVTDTLPEVCGTTR